MWLALPLAAAAFAKRGMATYLSYRVKFLMSLASLSLSVVTFALVGKVVSTAGSGFVERYGTDYASFAVTGVAVHTIASSGLSCFRSAVRREQLQGTLETLFTSSLPPGAAVFLAGLGELVMVLAGGALFLGLARAFLDVRIIPTPAALIAVLLYGAFMSGLGLASAGCILVSKEGEPVSWLFGAASGLLGGVYFPVDLLPSWLQHAARAIPTAHALGVVRSSCAGASVPSGGPCSLLVLSLCASVSMAVGILALRCGYGRARRRGTLGEY
ncbi:MAG: hypothetical protein GF400_00725 [Candidatus Eisenbacteria bacterium]|nr:hypothetical protein [Candidatus Eisenbacteria bacterium]